MNKTLQVKVLIAQINNNYDFKANINRINISLQKYSSKDEIDILVFPEMALIGYYYPDKNAIKPYLEEYAKGPTYEFCKQLALKLKCYVACGYAEVDGDKLYNSAVVVNREGEAVLNVRKKHLFETDKTWADEGQEFKCLEIKTTKNQKIKFAFGICMDINPWEFKDNSKFELADFCIQNQVDGLIFMAAWNDHEPDNNDNSGILDYWVWRLKPIRDGKSNNYHKQFLFVCSDKVGKDEKTQYMGSSCLIKLNPAKLIQDLEKKQESYLICNVQL
ncbi:unnamed protein product [Paramecium primaurelia]|uniref:CN hydrolase domain-containing protein n=1 Tax=Paramecium primaurelia TaxID=5886 RepID=A0A8S1KIM0_PARPR|nr:unnamed protein product [Paramecium primaurelia]